MDAGRPPGVDPAGRRRAVRAFVLLGTGATAAVLAAAGAVAALILLSWPYRDATANPVFGINFSCNHAEYLLLEDPAPGEAGYLPDDRPGRAEWCAATLERLLRESGARHVRLSAEWAQVEPERGRYDWSLLDAQVAAAGRAGATVLLTVGMKAQRHPEFYLPAWATAGMAIGEGAVLSDIPVLREGALRVAGAIVERYAASPVIDAWGAENEPYVPTPRANEWRLGRDYVQELVQVIRSADPAGRPVVVSHGQRWVFDRFEVWWRRILEDADVLAVSVYPVRPFSLFGQDLALPVFRLFGPLMPNLAHQARTSRAAGRQYWVTELQAEPWAQSDVRRYGLGRPAPGFGPGTVRGNIELARKTGAGRVYLWGAEWWLLQLDRDADRGYLEAARAALAQR